MTEGLLADKLAKKYMTRNPFDIASCLDMIVVHAPLYGVRGFYQYFLRNNIIYIDNNLSEDDKKFVCAHELGHAVLHTKINTMFLDSRTYQVTSKYEIEANRFAVDLIYSDDYFRDLLHFTIPQIAKCLNISETLVKYKIKSLQ